MKRYIYLTFLVAGCYTAKKAIRDIQKAQDLYPEVVAKKTSEWYPCIPYKVSTDSSAYKDWLRSFDSIGKVYFGLYPQVPDTITFNVHDTIKEKCLDKKTILKYREVMKKMPSIHDTIYKIDSANRFFLSKKASDCESDRLDILKKYLRFKNYLIWALILLFISLILNILQFKFKR